jgi:hypothetical protein
MIKKYQIGQDHLMDFLEKRMIALGWKMPTTPPWEQAPKTVVSKAEVSQKFQRLSLDLDNRASKTEDAQKFLRHSAESPASQEKQENPSDQQPSVLKKMSALSDWGI